MARQKSTHVDDPAAVGERISTLRRARGLRQSDLSFPGCTTAYISRIEAGARIPSLQLLREIGKRLGATADYLATGATGSATPEDVRLLDAKLSQQLREPRAANTAFESLVMHDDPAVRAEAMLGLGQLALERGAADEAVRWLEECDRLQAGLPLDVTVTETLARAYAARGDAEAARVLLERRLGQAEDQIERSRLLVALSAVLTDLDQLDAAHAAISEVVSAFGPEPDALQVARLYWSQSRAQAERGDHDRAADHANEALAILRAVDHHAQAARAHQILAGIELERGQPEVALAVLDRALPLVARFGDSARVARCDLDRARALADLGRVDEARVTAIALAPRLDGLKPTEHVEALALLADLQAGIGAVDEALASYAAAVELLADQENDALLTDLYRRWSDLLAASGDTSQAYEVARRALGPHGPAARTPSRRRS